MAHEVVEMRRHWVEHHRSEVWLQVLRGERLFGPGKPYALIRERLTGVAVVERSWRREWGRSYLFGRLRETAQNVEAVGWCIG